jgi:hypothetical protein
MATIEQRYLPPPDYETTIAETDRPRIYDAVRKQLVDLLEGSRSYYPDGVQKDWQARADDLDRYIKSFMGSQGRVNDPADILGDVMRYLRAHAKNFRDRIDNAGPSDKIELPPELSPTTRDRNELYVDPNAFAPPMKDAPVPRQEWSISTYSDRPTGGANRPERRLAPPIFFPL